MGMRHDGAKCITLEEAKKILEENKDTPIHLQVLDNWGIGCDKCKATILNAREETGIWTSGKAIEPIGPTEQILVHRCPHCQKPLSATKAGFFRKAGRFLCSISDAMVLAD